MNKEECIKTASNLFKDIMTAYAYLGRIHSIEEVDHYLGKVDIASYNLDKGRDLLEDSFDVNSDEYKLLSAHFATAGLVVEALEAVRPMLQDNEEFKPGDSADAIEKINDLIPPFLDSNTNILSRIAQPELEEFQHCPICNIKVPASYDYLAYVCPKCTQRSTDTEGKPLVALRGDGQNVMANYEHDRSAAPLGDRTVHIDSKPYHVYTDDDIFLSGLCIAVTPEVPDLEAANSTASKIFGEPSDIYEARLKREFADGWAYKKHIVGLDEEDTSSSYLMITRDGQVTIVTFDESNALDDVDSAADVIKKFRRTFI